MVTGWFASSDWLAKNGATAKRLQVVMLQIAKWANANRAETQAIVPKYTKITPEVAAHMVRAVIGDTKPDPALIQPVIDVAVKYGGMQSLPRRNLSGRASCGACSRIVAVVHAVLTDDAQRWFAHCNVCPWSPG